MTILSKMQIHPDAPAAAGKNQPAEAQWTEARSVFSIYLAIAKQVGADLPFESDRRSLPETPDPELLGRVRSWLDQMDQQVQVHQLRRLLQTTTLNANEAGLRAMILRHLRKPEKSPVDRNKVDFMLVQYFALCAPAKIYHKQIEPEDVAQVMTPILGGADPTALALCAPLETMIEALRGFRSLREILKTNFIEQGRKVKESAGPRFYEPASLLAFVRFNFLLRRTFIELMHADLIAIRAVIGRLEAAEVQTMDCRTLGLGAGEPVGKIRQMADDWKQPFQIDYTERTINQAFEKLLALRSVVEKALAPVEGKSSEEPVSESPAQEARHPAAAESRNLAAVLTPTTNAPQGTEPAPKRTAPAPAAAELDFETCMEKIWEQLIATPPSRGRSMMTVLAGGARILMSSWEVAAFVTEDGPAAEDLRRAVVARALVMAAKESAKESGRTAGLDRALSVARVEVARLQERVDIAKQAKDTEAAVNLGISNKRLISALDEAEKL